MIQSTLRDCGIIMVPFTLVRTVTNQEFVQPHTLPLPREVRVALRSCFCVWGCGYAVGGETLNCERAIAQIHFGRIKFEVFKHVLNICLIDNNTAKKLFSWKVHRVTRLTVTLPPAGLVGSWSLFEISEFVPAVEEIDRAELRSTWSWWRV